MFHVYVIYNSERDKIYIGHTAGLEIRLKRHNGLLVNSKKSFTYKNDGLWRLVYKEEFETRDVAIKREKELKSYRGREFLKKIIERR